MTHLRYTELSPNQIADEFAAMACGTAAAFGRLSSAQLNWQPQAGTWSIAQCFDHLLKANHEMRGAIVRALDPHEPLSVWQRLPLWPRLCGWMLVRSQGPGGHRKYEAPSTARPVSSAIGPDVIDRFIASQHSHAEGVLSLGTAAVRRVMVSPFVAQIAYSVLDGYRLIAAHQRRHFEQAQRVAAHPDFPRSSCA